MTSAEREQKRRQRTAFLRAWNQVSLKVVAKACGMHLTSISRKLDGTIGCTSMEWARIASALGTTLAGLDDDAVWNVIEMNVSSILRKSSSAAVRLTSHS